MRKQNHDKDMNELIRWVLVFWQLNSDEKINIKGSEKVLMNIVSEFSEKRFDEVGHINLEIIYNYVEELNLNNSNIINRELFNVDDFLFVMKPFLKGNLDNEKIISNGKNV